MARRARWWRLYKTPAHPMRKNWTARIGMLLWGTANPEGLQSSSGMYLSDTDIHSIVKQIERAYAKEQPIPVHIEHKGVAVGHVVTGWAHNRRLECVLQLDGNVLEGAIGGEFIKNKVCKDLSLGYMVTMRKDTKGDLIVDGKELKEISVVKKGAREKCHIHGFTG